MSPRIRLNHRHALTSSMNYLFLWLSDGANIGTMQQAAAIVSMAHPLIKSIADIRSPLVSVGEKQPEPCKPNIVESQDSS